MRATRRRFIGQAGLTVGGLLSGAGAYAAGAGETATVSIFHTTDLHGNIVPTSAYDGTPDLGGLARCATQIRKWREENPHSILVDVGDLYQGTPVSWMTRGRLMVELLNKLRYDAWVLGNHEFDWGVEVVTDAVVRSKMPVMTGNLELDGRKAGEFKDESHPLAGVHPHVVKEVDGFRIGLVGLVTPGLPYWLPENLRKGFKLLDPVETLRSQVALLRDEHKVDAVVVCGHMGWREREDFANPLQSMLEGEHGVDVFIAGHTHREMGSREVRGVLYSQANYFGIHCGRVDLTFDRETRRLVGKRAEVALMDSKIKEDPVVLEASAKDLGESREYLKREIGETRGVISARRGRAGWSGSPLQKLLCSAFEWHAKESGIAIDGVFHGTFGSGDLDAGKKTVADAWKMVPYDNNMVVVSLNREELIGVLNEALEGGTDRALFGFEIELERAEASRGEQRSRRFVISLRSLRHLDAKSGQRYRILFNSYDAQSGGKSLMRLRAIAQKEENRVATLPLSSREALIEYFLAKKVVDSEEIEKAS